MDHRWLRPACLMLGLLGLGLVGAVPGENPPGVPVQGISLEQFKPQWRVGDRWVVETTTLPLQAPLGQEGAPPVKPVQWQFSVRALERLFDRECYRIEVQPLPIRTPSPVTTFWVDRQSLVLRQVQAQLAVAGRLHTMTESYQFGSGQPTPVQGPLTALPIDLPLFTAGRAKGLQQFAYEAVAGPSGKKALGDVGFLMSIQQEMVPATAEHAKSLLPEGFAKVLDTKPTVEVRLKSIQGRVRQLWRPGCPWPVYADNGPTVARLVKIVPAPTQPNNPPEVRP